MQSTLGNIDVPANAHPHWPLYVFFKVVNTMTTISKNVVDAFKYLWGIVFNSGNDVMPYDEALEILEQAECSNSESVENKKDEHQIADNTCFERSGKVTYVDEHYGIIDNKLYFEDIDITKYRVGMQLSYLAYKLNGDTKISKIITEQDKDWGETDNKESHPLSRRRVVGQVKTRKGRILKVSPPGVEFDLNKVESEFIPLVGDFLVLESYVEVDEEKPNLEGAILEVLKISPVLTKVVNGVIKQYDPKTETGIINDNIWFHKDVCVPGYVPIFRDKVTAELIESNHGPGCSWRSVKVIPSEDSPNKHFAYTDDSENQKLVENKNDIVVSDNVQLTLNKIGDKVMFVLEVTNSGNSVQIITACTFKAHESQLSLVAPSLENRKVSVDSKQTLIFKFRCQARFMGMTKEMIVFDFDKFTIGRWIKIHVGPQMAKKDYIKNYYQRNERNLTKCARESFLNSSKEVVIGQRPVKPPSFISNKLPMFDIPDRIADVLFDQMEACQYVGHIPAERISPCLSENLSIQNYTDRFHTLLYLEELALQVNMRRYDMQRACFVKSGEFLVLEVQDLSERRPSIIIGDKVIASNPNDPKAMKLEGFVHKTGMKHLYIKFNPNFHNMYNGEDYTVEFHSSRTNFRRYHQAVDLAVRNLGQLFLFPKSVPSKEPQITFIVENEINDLDESSDSSQDSDDASVRTVDIKSKYVVMARRAMMNKRKNDNKSKSNSSSSGEINKKKVITSKLKLEWHDKTLNYFQREAVKNILYGVARPLPYFIFGPPGTGKTVTLIETILQILRLIPHSRLLVVAPSNSAADLIALRLLDSGVLIPGDLVRMVAFRCVAEGTIPERLVPFCVTGDLAREGSRESRSHTQNGVNIGVQASVLGRHRITIGTCMVVGVLYTMGFPRGHFTHIIIDEAGQATEPEVMIPLSLLDITSAQTVLAGDPLQLGPCVFSLLSKEYGLGESFFERIINRFPYSRDTDGFPTSGGFDPRLVTRLIFNYRSLPEILNLPNDLFYNSELQPTISGENGAEVDLLRRISEMLPERNVGLPPAVIFHGVRGENFQTMDCPSWFNPVEAGQVFYYINDLYRLGVKAEDIGIITPYIKQGQQVKALLIEAEMPLPKIGSVEEFQGQEFKIVILSTVRSNETGAKNDAKYGLGFIASPRRLNVAISRAQALLIIVGNPHLLCTDNYWRSVLLYAYKIHGYRGCDMPHIDFKALSN